MTLDDRILEGEVALALIKQARQILTVEAVRKLCSLYEEDLWLDSIDMAEPFEKLIKEVESKIKELKNAKL